MITPGTVLSEAEISEARGRVERCLKARKDRHGVHTVFDSRLLATLDAARDEARQLRERLARPSAPDRGADSHARRADEALRRLRAALERLDPVLTDAARALPEAPGRPLEIVRVDAPARLWWDLHQAWLGSEPWPLEVLGPVPVAVEVKPTPEAPHWGSRMAPALFSRGHHQHAAFVMLARSAARERGLPRPMLSAEPLAAQVNHRWWLPPDPLEGRPGWGPARSGDARAVPVTVWSDPIWEGGAAPTVAS